MAPTLGTGPFADLNAEWRLAHHLSSVGAGYHWPNVSIWGEGSRVGFAVHADANNLQPSLKFVAQPRLTYVASSTVEDAIDRFVGHVLEHVGNASDGLDTEYRQLQAERTDSTVATWRKLEAMLGFDPDDAPDGLVDGLETLTERYGSEPLQEAALAHDQLVQWFASQEYSDPALARLARKFRENQAIADAKLCRKRN